MDYSKFISPKRRAVPTPKDMVTDGKCVFGTFDKEFETMDLLSLKKPTGAPQFMNKLKLSLWEAVEVNFEQGVLLSAVCDMGWFGTSLMVFFDKRKKKVFSWSKIISSKQASVSPNLLNGATTEGDTNGGKIRFINNFQDGKCSVSGQGVDGENKLDYSFELERISKPCVASIPFGNNRPLYSQKDFFKATGSLTFNGETFNSTDVTTAIIDDHRGYYPRKAHYDWVTTMGKNVTDGTERWLAFNLTRNQSINQEDYNENLIWFENDTSILPPVNFVHSPATKNFTPEKGATWTVKDEHGMVDLKFKVYDLYKMIVHAGIVNIDYYITFGELEGFVLDEAGNKYVLDGMTGIGEDKTLLF